MAVFVYPRLGELLRYKSLSVSELQRHIRERYGLRVDSKTLYRLVHGDPVQRADLEIVGAAAAVLGVDWGELFDVRAIPVGDVQSGNGQGSSSEKARRMSELFGRRSEGELDENDQYELEALVMEFSRQLHDQRVRKLARKHQMTLEEARKELKRQFDEAAAEWAISRDQYSQ